MLAYVAQEAVQHYGWLKPGEMLDGLGMAETTPGPLIMVVQFVGFMGAYRDPGSLNPMTAATLAAILTTWVTFVPCFLWIFLGAPFIERLRNNVALTGAMSAITAAVVGVTLNLGRFSLDVPVLSSLVLPSLVLTVAAGLAIFRFRASVIATLLACAVAGMIWTLMMS